MDGENKYTGICYGENYRGILAKRGQKVVIGKDHKPKVVEQFGDGRNWPSSSRNTAGTNTTSSPGGTTSSRRSTAI